jgi:hypothetical protein
MVRNAAANETASSGSKVQETAETSQTSQALTSRAALGSKARAMRDNLAAQPKVRVFIPLAPGEKQGVTQSVILNGYPMYILKGQYVDVPQAVAEVLEAKLKQKMSVENHPDRVKADGTVKLVNYGA